MRLRPVLPNAEPRRSSSRSRSAAAYPPGVVLIASAYLVHHDPAIYPEPYAFRPERFLECRRPAPTPGSPSAAAGDAAWARASRCWR